jgi:lipopolysaccharide/colanic/teichoic acid biosynthesis glycosyltransferase
VAVIALAVRLSSRGPASFHQQQVTKDGRILRMYKFRTLRTGGRAFDTLITSHGSTGMWWPCAWVSG